MDNERSERERNMSKMVKGKERKGKELAHLYYGSGLRATVHSNPTSKHQHKQPHAYNMQMYIYILHAYSLCISNMLIFVLQIYSTKHTQISPTVAALLTWLHSGMSRS